jgi:hypothetical protein
LSNGSVTVRSLRGKSVFISGRIKDLTEERKQVEEFFEREGAIVYRFETISGGIPRDICRRLASTSDIYVGIYGGSYKQNKKHILVFIKDEPRDPLQTEFINRIQRWDDGVLAPSFMNVDELIMKLRNSIETIIYFYWTSQEYPDQENCILSPKILTLAYKDIPLISLESIKSPSYVPVTFEEEEELLAIVQENEILSMNCDDIGKKDYPLILQKFANQICTEHGGRVATRIQFYINSEGVLNAKYTYT